MMKWQELESYKQELLLLKSKLDACNKELEKAYSRIRDLEIELSSSRKQLAEAYKIIAKKELLNRKLKDLLTEMEVPLEKINELEQEVSYKMGGDPTSPVGKKGVYIDPSYYASSEEGERDSYNGVKNFNNYFLGYKDQPRSTAAKSSTSSKLAKYSKFSKNSGSKK